MIYHQFLTIGQFLFSVSFMIDYIKFLFKAIFTCGVKKLLYELNSSDITRFETLSIVNYCR